MERVTLIAQVTANDLSLNKPFLVGMQTSTATMENSVEIP